MTRQQVALSDATYDSVPQALDNLVNQLHLQTELGQLKDRTVFLKPNLLGLFPPEKQATTHPSVIRELVAFFERLGARVVVGDNCGLGGYGLSEKVAAVTGAADAAGSHYLNVARRTCSVETNSKYLDSFAVSQDMLEADYLVNVPKMKTHSLTVVTGAVKNMFGIIAGGGKSHCHKIAPQIEAFSELLADVFCVRPPDLTIMDAVVAMEGAGPTSGRPKKVGKLIAATNAVALDAVMCRIMGVAPEGIPHLRILQERGVGSVQEQAIEVLGQLPQVGTFALPSAVKYFGFLGTLVNAGFFGTVSRSSLRLKKKACVQCKICLEACPTEAMEWSNAYPKINDNKCIKCMCCNEMCPESAWKVGGLMGIFQGRGV